MRREALAKARRDRGYSQEALANEIGVASGTLAKWEQGLTRPQARQLPALARALGTTLDGATALLDESDGSPVPQWLTMFAANEQASRSIRTISATTVPALLQSHDYGAAVERTNVIASELIPLERAREKLAKSVRIRLDARDVTQEKVLQIRSICQHHKGNRPFSIVVQTDRGRVHATADKGLCVNPDVEFCRKMKQLIGEDNFALAK